MKRFNILLVFIFSCNLISDEGDIVETKTVNSDDYLVNKDSYCRNRTSSKNLNWSEEFEENSISKSTWRYAVSNGFKDRGQYISGWGNGELQYYTRPSKKINDLIHLQTYLLKMDFLKYNQLKRILGILTILQQEFIPSH